MPAARSTRRACRAPHRHDAATEDLRAHRDHMQAKNSRVKPSAITINGRSMLGSMVGPPSRNTEAG